MNSTRHHLAEIIGEKTLHINDYQALVKEIAAFLLHENKVSDLEPLMRDIMEYRAKKGIYEAVVISARKLDNNVKEEIKDLLKANYEHIKSIRLDEEIDSEVIGGFRLQLPEEQFDATVLNRLSRFKQLITQERS